MAWRLARKGYEIHTYAPIPKDCPKTKCNKCENNKKCIYCDGTGYVHEWRNTYWHPLKKANFKLDGLWILYRCPQTLDKFGPITDKQPRWLIMQDWDYPSWTEERVAKLNRIVPLCYAHKNWLVNRHPELEKKCWVTRNGIKTDLIDEVEKEGIPERNLKRIMYASSPDRGLLPALKIFKRA